METQQNIQGSLLTTWPCITEAMYFLGDLRGWTGQNILWQFVERKALYILNHDEQQQQRMKTLMEKYRDVPMDLADASLVAVAEAHQIKRIFTLDSDFYIYLINDKEPFEVIP